MKDEQNNFAYIDGANLYRGIEALGWNLDYKRFRIWLKEKYSISRAYLFIGLIPKNKDLYTYLQECGFTLIYKEVVYDDSGKAKGNCDADLVLKVAQDAFENACEKCVIVTSDGDYSSLISFLLDRKKLIIVLSPSNVEKCSVLLKRTNAPIAFLNDQRNMLELKNKKAPGEDKTSQGSFS